MSGISSSKTYTKLPYIIILTLLIINLLLLSEATYRAEKPTHHLTKYDGKGTKISMFKHFNELAKISNCNLIATFLSFMKLEKLGRIHSLRPTFQNPNYKSMDELGKVMS